jgi:hypothetical protein
MSLEQGDGRGLARCDRCGLVTPRMKTANRQAIADVIHAAGWTTPDELTSLCPRCARRSAGDYARLQRRAVTGWYARR